MGSSLVNDHDNVHDTIERLITIANLLYVEEDPLFPETPLEPTGHKDG
jgi:hypothetical protein